MPTIPPFGLGSGSGSGLGDTDISGLAPPPTSPIPPAPASLSAEADPPVTPPTSPQRSQHAARQVERDSRLMGSPENRRTPAAPTPAPLPSMRPATFNGRQYSHLPAHLADQLAALLPLPTPQRCPHGSAAAAPVVSSLLIIKVFVLIITALQAPAPPFTPIHPTDHIPVQVPGSSAAAASSSVPVPTPAALAPPQTILTCAHLAAAHAALPPLRPQRVRSVTASVCSNFLFYSNVLILIIYFSIRCHHHHHHHLSLLFTLTIFDLLVIL